MAPHVITDAEWSELAEVQQIREMFSLEGTTEDGELLASCCYGARFDYMNGSPGYIGDLFVLVSDHLGGPFLLTRQKDGRLTLTDDEDPYLVVAREAGYQERIRLMREAAHTNQRWYPRKECRSYFMLSGGVLLESPMGCDGSKGLAHHAVDWDQPSGADKLRLLDIVDDLSRLP